MLALLLLAGAGSTGAGVELVASPTRLDQMHRTAKVGDTLVIDETLQGADGTPQNLTGATVRFTLRGQDGTVLISLGACTIRGSTTAGKVRYRGTVPARRGVCTFEFEARWPDQSEKSFPDGTYASLTVVDELA